MERISRQSVTFARPLVLDGVEGELPPGIYEVELVEEPLEGLSFSAYRLVSASVVLPLKQGLHSYQLVRIPPALVREAQACSEIAAAPRDHSRKPDAEKPA